MSDSEKLRLIIRFEVDPAPFREDTEENPFFDLNTLLSWYYFVSDELAEHYEAHKKRFGENLMHEKA